MASPGFYAVGGYLYTMNDEGGKFRPPFVTHPKFRGGGFQVTYPIPLFCFFRYSGG